MIQSRQSVDAIQNKLTRKLMFNNHSMPHVVFNMHAQETMYTIRDASSMTTVLQAQILGSRSRRDGTSSNQKATLNIGLIRSIPLQLFEFTDLLLQFVIFKSYHYNFTTLRNITLLITLSTCFLKLMDQNTPAFLSLSSPLSSLHGQTPSAAALHPGRLPRA